MHGYRYFHCSVEAISIVAVCGRCFSAGGDSKIGDMTGPLETPLGLGGAAWNGSAGSLGQL